jgi:hypothetical protein
MRPNPAVVERVSREWVDTALKSLLQKGLVTIVGFREGEPVYQLTLECIERLCDGATLETIVREAEDG